MADIPQWDADAIEQRTSDLMQRFLEVWPRRSDTPMNEEDDLQRVSELEKPNLRGYPEVFEYAEFNGEPWDSVHMSKQLFVRLVDELCTIDEARFAASEYGRYVKAEPDRGFS